MEEIITKIIEEEQKIQKIIFPDESLIKLGTYDEIRPYHEDGEMSPVVWFALIQDNKVLRRINSKYVSEVVYD